MKNKVPLCIGILYFFNLIIYPQWYIPDSTQHLRYILAAFFLLLTFGAFLLSRHLVSKSFNTGQQRAREIWKEHKFEFVAGIFCFITHLSFLQLPIPTLGDCHMHAGLPALALAKLNLLCIEKIGISFRIIFLFCLCMSAILYRWRSHLAKFLTSTKGFSLVIVSGIIYIIFVNYFSIPERFGKLEHFFRYPALGKSLFFTGYTIFGIHEWVGRIIQIAFLFAGAIYFAKLLEMLSNRKVAQAGYVIYLMFPPFWELAHQNYLTAGVIFFSTATIYYLTRFLQRGKIYDIYIAMGIMAMGITYKRLLIAMIPISCAIVVAYSLLRKREKLNIKKVSAALFLPLGLVIPNLFLFYYLRRLYPYYPQGTSLQHFLFPQRLIENLHFVPYAIGWPLVFIAIIGLFLALRYQKTLFAYFSIWFTGYWILISATDAYCFVRHSLIEYIPIAGFIAFCTGTACRKLSCGKLLWKIPLFSCVLCLYMCFLCLRIVPGETISSKKAGEFFLPYDKLFQFIKHEQLYNHRIYAPMKCEPSHFYMAKYGMTDTDFLFRKKWDKEAYREFNDFLFSENFRYLVIPQGPRVKGIIEEYFDEMVLSELLNGKAETYIRLDKIFRHGENSLLLFKLNAPSARCGCKVCCGH